MVTYQRSSTQISTRSKAYKRNESDNGLDPSSIIITSSSKSKRKTVSTNNDIKRNKNKAIINISTLCITIAALLWLWFLFQFRNHLAEDNMMIMKHWFDSIDEEDHTTQVTKTATIRANNQNSAKISTFLKRSNEKREQKDDTPILSMYGRHRFDQSFDALPKWLQEYFTWHRRQTSPVSSSTLSSSPSKITLQSKPTDTKYVVLACLAKDTLCGGLSDRLRPILFYLFIAHRSNRVLCIYWEKPFLLENFLQPIPDVGIDWRCPSEVRDLYDSNNQFNQQPIIKPVLFGYCQKNQMPMAPCVQKDLESFQENTEQYVTLDLATHSNDCINNANMLAQKYSYKNYTMPDIKHWEYPELIADVFRVMFEPIPALARRINSTMASLGLVENEFVTAHVRARYPAGYVMKYLNAKRNATFDKDGGLKFEGKLKHWIDGIVKNAIKCVHLLAPDLKVFFVSDHTYATHYAMTTDIFGENNKIVRAIGIEREEDPLHMDGNHNQYSNVTDFYNVFEDLLIMGGSRCVSHGIGSFGSFGAGLAGNRCRAVHRKYSANSVTCPNDRGERKAISFTAEDMMDGDKSGKEGTIEFKK